MNRADPELVPDVCAAGAGKLQNGATDPFMHAPGARRKAR